MQGQSLLDMIESTYASFRKALELMVLNTTCPCNACRNLPNLDLKFFVHFGSYMTQKLGNFTELVGNDVNLVHRLAKNHIKEKTGFKAYAAFTQSVMDALGLADFQNSLTPHRETFADVGEVQMYVHDMHKVWERLKDRVRIEVRPEEALLIREYDVPRPSVHLVGVPDEARISRHPARSEQTGASQPGTGTYGGRFGFITATTARWKPGN